MISARNFCDVEVWTVTTLVDACSNDPIQKRKVTIPEYQRRLVWSKEKQQKLIRSIKNGYPFGSLLLFDVREEENGRRLYQLIDGLQRTNAMLKYIKEPNQFFSVEDVDDNLVNLILTDLNLVEKKTSEDVKRMISKWVRDRKGFDETDDWRVDNLLQDIVVELIGYERGTPEFFHSIGVLSTGDLSKEIAKFLKQTREEADIKEAKIPIIIYSGSSSELPTIFEWLNSQGTALSRYEIYAAQWIESRHKINNSHIIDAIWQKYEALQEEGFSLDVIDDAPDKKTRQKKDYTLFEYLFGFGQYLATAFEHLFSPVAPERPSSVGFNLFTACTGLHVKDMDKLPKRVGKRNITQMESWILECVKFIDGILNPFLILKQKGAKSLPIYHTEFQIISFIAKAFQLRYDFEGFFEREGWRNDWNRLEKTLPMFYLFDILRGYWRGSGDTKMFDSIQSNRYTNIIKRSQWEATLQNWFLDEQLTKQHKRRYISDGTPEILFLKYLYVHLFTVFENTGTYHIEHLVPVGQLVDAMGESKGWPINSVSNLALLDSITNMSKGNMTFTEYLREQLSKGKISDDYYYQQIEHYSSRLICPPNILPLSLTENLFTDFLIERFNYLIDLFLDNWQDYIEFDSASTATD